MSRGSRIGVRAKQEWTKSLEQIHKSEIDEFLRSQVIPTCRDCNADLASNESEVCFSCKCYWGEDDIDDEYWGYDLAHEDWFDERYDDLYYDYYDPYGRANLSDPFGYDDEWDVYGPFMLAGNYYRDKSGHTYLCCRIDDRTLLVSVLTGREANVSYSDVELVS